MLRIPIVDRSTTNIKYLYEPNEIPVGGDPDRLEELNTKGESCLTDRVWVSDAKVDKGVKSGYIEIDPDSVRSEGDRKEMVRGCCGALQPPSECWENNQTDGYHPRATHVRVLRYASRDSSDFKFYYKRYRPQCRTKRRSRTVLTTSGDCGRT